MLLFRDISPFTLTFEPKQVISARNATGGRFKLGDDFPEIGGINPDQFKLIAMHSPEGFRLNLVFFLCVSFLHMGRHASLISLKRARCG